MSVYTVRQEVRRNGTRNEILTVSQKHEITQMKRVCEKLYSVAGRNISSGSESLPIIERGPQDEEYRHDPPIGTR